MKSTKFELKSLRIPGIIRVDGLKASGPMAILALAFVSATLVLAVF